MYNYVIPFYAQNNHVPWQDKKFDIPSNQFYSVWRGGT